MHRESTSMYENAQSKNEYMHQGKMKKQKQGSARESEESPGSDTKNEHEDKEKEM